MVARERRSVMMSERRVVKDGVEGEGGVPSVRHPGQEWKRWSRESREWAQVGKGQGVCSGSPLYLAEVASVWRWLNLSFDAKCM